MRFILQSKKFQKILHLVKDSLCCEHFKHAHGDICKVLSLLFNSMLSHNYLPLKLMDSLLIPLLKDKKGDISDQDNYKTVTLINVVSEILETVRLNRYSSCLTTSDHQFGFNQNMVLTKAYLC